MVLAWGQHGSSAEYSWSVMWEGNLSDNLLEQALDELRRVKRKGYKAVRLEWRGDRE